MARNHKATGLADFICFTIPARRRVQGLRIDGSSGTLQQRLKSAARGPDVPQQARSSKSYEGGSLSWRFDRTACLARSSKSSQVHHAFFLTARFPGDYQEARNWRAFAAAFWSPRRPFLA